MQRALSPSSLSSSVRQHPRLLTPVLITSLRAPQVRHQHAIANPLLAGIEKRWEGMPPQEQAEIWMKLRDRMKVNWKDLTAQEKKAAYWIAFGPHGPRAGTPPGTGWWLFKWTTFWVGVSAVLFAGIRSMARDPPRTMTKEWQEATNEYLKSQNVEPISGISSEGYKGKGYVQSRPSKTGKILEPEE